MTGMKSEKEKMLSGNTCWVPGKINEDEKTVLL
jgi:hypothetical protein